MSPFATLVTQLALDLIDGRIVLLQGLPRSGRSAVLQGVRLECGSTAVLVAGRSISEANHRSEAGRIETVLVEQVQRHGSAQLLVDDFGAIMRAPYGHAFQGALRAVVVDGDLSSDIGCLLGCGLSDPIRAQHRRGSPLTAAAHFRLMPWLSDEEVSSMFGGSFDTTPDAALRLCGSNVSLLDRFAKGGKASVEAFARSTLDRWLGDLTVDDLAQLEHLVRGATEYRSEHDRLAPLLYRSGDRVELAGVIPRPRLEEILLGPWPSDLAASARRFAVRIGNETAAVWVDKYVLHASGRLGEFLPALAVETTASRLTILTTRDGLDRLDRQALTAGLAGAESEGLRVTIRLAARRDFPELHARQLLLRTARNGYVVPPADRIVGLAPIGNEADAPLSSPDWALIDAALGRSERLVLIS